MSFMENVSIYLMPIPSYHLNCNCDCVSIYYFYSLKVN